MTRRHWLIAPITAAPALAMAAGDEAAVETAEKAWATGVVKNDYALLEKVLADDLYYSHSSGAEDTKRSYIDKLKSGEARYYGVEFKSLKVRVLDAKTALAMHIAVYTTKTSDGGKQALNLKALHVYRNNGGQWQLTAHQSARMP
jgi:ketosteroid isomerase-like protein